MDVFECVSTLSSVRSFIDKEVNEDLIMKVLQAGRLAPSAHNDQPWKFILIRDKHRISKLQRYCLSGSFVSQSAFCVVILTKRSSKWYQVDGTRAVQNMVLTAWENGLGSCWIGRIDDKGLSEFLNIPEDWHILTVLPFGYFRRENYFSRKIRKPEEDVFCLEKFGTPMPQKD